MPTRCRCLCTCFFPVLCRLFWRECAKRSRPAFRIIVSAEMIAAQAGIGFLILNSALFYQTNRVIVGIIVLGYSRDDSRQAVDFYHQERVSSVQADRRDRDLSARVFALAQGTIG